MLESTVSIASRSGDDTVPMRRRIKRVDGRTRIARRIKTLIACYVRRLGDLAADPIVRADLSKLAEHEALAEDLRGMAVRRQHINHAVLNQHERAVRRLRAALALDRLPEPPPPPSLDSYRRAKQEAPP